MSERAERRPPLRTRREPPPFRHVAAVGVERMSDYLVRVILGGPDLDRLVVDPIQPRSWPNRISNNPPITAHVGDMIGQSTTPTFPVLCSSRQLGGDGDTER